MAIVPGDSGSSGVRDGNATASFVVTITEANSTIAVGISSRDTTDADRVVSSVTVDGSATGCSQVRTDTETATGNMSTAIWRCLNPPIGDVTVLVTMAGTCDRLAAGGVVLTGVDQTTPVSASNGSTSTTAGVDPSTSVTAASNGFVFDAYYDTAAHAGLSIGAGQNEVYFAGVNAAGDSAGGSYEGPVTGSTTMSWINDASGSGYCHTVAAFQPAGVGRTSKNTRGAPLGLEVGMNLRGH